MDRLDQASISVAARSAIPDRDGRRRADNQPFCAFLSAPCRSYRGGLTKAACLSARSDAIANIATIVAGLITAFLRSPAWPDLIVGIGIAAMNADAPREVFKAATGEHRSGVEA